MFQLGNLNKLKETVEKNIKFDSSEGKMFSLSQNVRDQVLVPLFKWIIPLSAGVKGFGRRSKVAYWYINRLLVLREMRGLDTLVKQLKSDHVALQRAAAGNPMSSLRELEPELSLWKLTSAGYPIIIKKLDPRSYTLLRKGDPIELKFWLTLFGLYRILSCTPKLKLKSITEPFSGDPQGLALIEDYAKSFNPFLSLSPFRIIKDNWTGASEVWNYYSDLVSGNLVKRVGKVELRKLNSAGPNTNPSYLGLFEDAKHIVNSNMFNHFKDYLNKLGIKETSPMIRSNAECKDTFISRISHASSLSREFTPEEKTKMRLGKLSPKLEAAGKIRIFAIVDSWTQSLLSPLHKVLFSILRMIPNDGTFEQNDSVNRLITKIKESNLSKVYSFDLSAATDRLPISLQSHILDTLLGIKDIGKAWANILVDREYVLLRNKSLNISPQTIRYAVGQPMGALSSWAMLAITHHWILQYCNRKVLHNEVLRLTAEGFQGDCKEEAIRTLKWERWSTAYEILGDDLVILDEKLAAQYLEVCQLLGVEINLSKSIQSTNGSFEFAKRTVIKGEDVSGVCWKQFLDYGSLPTVVNTLLQYTASCKKVSINSLLVAVSRQGIFWSKTLQSKKRAWERLEFSLIAMLSHYTSRGIVPFSWFAAWMMDPEGKSKDLLPVQQTIRYLNQIKETLCRSNILISSPKAPTKLNLSETDSKGPLSNWNKRIQLWGRISKLYCNKAIGQLYYNFLGQDRRLNQVADGNNAGLLGQGFNRIIPGPEPSGLSLFSFRRGERLIVSVFLPGWKIYKFTVDPRKEFTSLSFQGIQQVEPWSIPCPLLPCPLENPDEVKEWLLNTWYPELCSKLDDYSDSETLSPMFSEEGVFEQGPVQLNITLDDQQLFIEQLMFIWDSYFSLVSEKLRNVHDGLRCYYDKYQRTGTAFDGWISTDTVKELIESQETINLLSMDCDFSNKKSKPGLDQFIPKEFESFKESILLDKQKVGALGEDYLDKVNIKNMLSPGHRWYVTADTLPRSESLFGDNRMYQSFNGNVTEEALEQYAELRGIKIEDISLEDFYLWAYQESGIQDSFDEIETYEEGDQIITLTTKKEPKDADPEWGWRTENISKTNSDNAERRFSTKLSWDDRTVSEDHED